MGIRPWSAAAVVATACGLATATPVAAQQRPQCPPAPNLQSSSTAVETKVAADALTKILGKLGVDVDVRTTRDSVLKDNPRADQAVIVLTMANTMCEMIWSDPALSGEQKASRYSAMMIEILARVAGPAPVARTGDKQSLRRSLPRGVHLVASLEGRETDTRRAAPPAATGAPALPVPGQSGFLRDIPFYITDNNKYFVIVASPRSREEGLRLLERFKAKTPQYDFALYQPYGSNTSYGVMMASWVPREIATEALRLARRDVAADAYLWSCRSTGTAC